MIEKSCLKVNMMGNFIMEYQGKELPFAYKSSSKNVQLLLILLFHGEKGIERNRLLEILYGKEESANPSNTLRATVFRLKKHLIALGLPDDEYIQNKKGKYFWSSQYFYTWVDVIEFEQLAQKGLEETGEQQLDILKKACELYQGELLPAFAAKEWVAVASVHLQELYFTCLRKACDRMKEKHQYEEMLEMCKKASDLYPFEEWQFWQIDCLMALERYKEALKAYENATNLFFEELGLSPSEKMLARFRTMSGQIHYATGAITDIKDSLREKEWLSGAYYCSYPSFIDSYRLVARMLERTEQSACLMMCTFVSQKGNTANMNEEIINQISEQLAHSIKYSVRRGDLYTRYSPSQFLLLLMRTTKENCTIITERISKKFAKESKNKKIKIQFYVEPVLAQEN